MAKNPKSQWDFGELFPAEATRKVLSVSEITAQVRRLLEQNVGTIWVTGEITNFRQQSSGHIYFTLKDAFAQLTCVLFRGEPVNDRAALRDGQKVILRGEMTVYEARGQYQLRVTAIELQGVGALQIAFEKLKQKLQGEGLFAPERKRPLPKFPQRIGLVTSPTGAAIRDVLHVIARRNPSLEIVFVPCSVQGQAAGFEISAAIKMLNRFSEQNLGFFGETELFGNQDAPSTNRLDLILVTRGGGSLEDLWAFNEEAVARAIFESKVPVVSAVGHEIDFTISDFVADFRAATPSAAAEIITEGVFSSCRFISETADWLHLRVRQRFERETKNLRQWTDRLQRSHPRRKLNEKLQRVDDLQISLARCVKHDLRKQMENARQLRERLNRIRPARLFEQKREIFSQEQTRLREQIEHRMKHLRQKFETLETRLRLLSPENTLARGYSITMHAATGKILRSASEIQPGQKMKTRLKSGEIQSVAEKVEPSTNPLS